MSLTKKNLKDFIEEAQQRYPIGTEFNIVHTGTRATVKSHNPHDDDIVISGIKVHVNMDCGEDGMCSVLVVSTGRYNDKKWAEIIN